MGKTDLGAALRRAKSTTPATGNASLACGQERATDPYRARIVEAAETPGRRRRQDPPAIGGGSS